MDSGENAPATCKYNPLGVAGAVSATALFLFASLGLMLHRRQQAGRWLAVLAFLFCASLFMVMLHTSGLSQVAFGNQVQAVALPLSVVLGLAAKKKRETWGETASNFLLLLCCLFAAYFVAATPVTIAYRP